MINTGFEMKVKVNSSNGIYTLVASRTLSAIYICMQPPNYFDKQERERERERIGKGESKKKSEI